MLYLFGLTQFQENRFPLFLELLWIERQGSGAGFVHAGFMFSVQTLFRS